MLDSGGDRIVIFYESHDEDWIVLRVCLFHYTIFKADILNLISVFEIELPKWLELLLSLARPSDYRPIPVGAYPTGLPTIQALLNTIPGFVTQDNIFPKFDGSQWGGIAVDAEGVPLTMSIPYSAYLADITYLGQNYWAQGGTLNPALCHVAQAILHYRREPLVRQVHPELNLAGYFEGLPFPGGRLWYAPDLQSQEGCGDSMSALATNFIRYYPGSQLYSIERSYNTLCPVPTPIPEGHFLHPYQGQSNVKIACTSPSFGVYSLIFSAAKTSVTPQELEDTPFGCVPGWPSDAYLAPYGLTNNDSVGLYEFASVEPLPDRPCQLPHSVPSYGQVVVEITEPDDLPVVSGGGAVALAAQVGVIMLVSGILQRKTTLVATEDKRLSIGGDPLSIGGFPIGT